MLLNLSIQNLAIVEQLDLDFASGLTTLTGETGAGKSIVIDSLGLVLGDRAGAEFVRHGTKKAEISALFDCSKAAAAQAWLDENELIGDEANECLLRRVVSAEGRSKAWINGSSVGLQQLRELGEHLAEIHGQHEHQSLLKREAQLQLLDDYGQLHNSVKKVQKAYQAWAETEQKLKQLQGSPAERADRMDYLRFQVNEFEQLNPNNDELAELEQEQRRLANAEELLNGCQRSLDYIAEQDDGDALSALNQAQREIERLSSLDSGYEASLELLNNAIVQVEEARDELRQQRDRVDLDPERLHSIDQRLSALHNLARKHRCELEALQDVWQNLAAELAELESAESSIDELTQQQAQRAANYQEAASKLSSQRAKVASKLGKIISTTMQPLGMPHAQCEIQLDSDPQRMHANGQDRAELLISMNPGQPLKALSKIASGGELSRVSLAIQVAAASQVATPCMVFDEVDTGIGGAVAELVGQHLQTLGQQHQVICITHLAQVAAHGLQQLHVRKSVQGGQTRSEIRPLSEAERIAELARMAGGVEITAETEAHARDMLQRAQRA